MGKIEINNEIVRMRQLVRQARVCVINKLVKEAKTLRTKNGTEKQKEKNKKKADKLLSEIYALKKIKDDRISKFAITNTKTLKEILESKNGSESTRIIARVANYKTLKNAVAQIRETYPDYEEHLQPKKTKSVKPKNRPTRKSCNKEVSGIQTRGTNRNTASTSSASGNFMQEESNLSDDTGSSNGEGNVNQSDLEAGNVLRINTASCAQQIKQKKSKYFKENKTNSVSSEKETLKLTDERESKTAKRVRVTETSTENEKQKTIKIVSKEATVKRFTELLQEGNKYENCELEDKMPIKCEPKSEKKVDDFFMSGDGNAYLSTAAAIVQNDENNMFKDEDTTVTRKSEELNFRTSFKRNQFFHNVKDRNARHERPGKEKYEYKQDNLNRSKENFRLDRKEKQKTLFKDKFKHNDVRHTNDVENLHPSWAAKKKQQEIMKTAFQGKKIVFDDA